MDRPEGSKHSQLIDLTPKSKLLLGKTHARPASTGRYTGARRLPYAGKSVRGPWKPRTGAWLDSNTRNESNMIRRV